MKNSTVDVVGVMLQVNPASSITLKDGSNRDKRSITIGDDTESSIDVTVWGELANEAFNAGQVIAFKGCRVSEFNGKSLNASFDRSDTIFKVNHPRAKELARWYSGAE